MRYSYSRVALLAGASISALGLAHAASAAPHDSLPAGTYAGEDTADTDIVICDLASTADCFFGVIDETNPANAVLNSAASGRVYQYGTTGADVTLSLSNAAGDTAELGAIASGTTYANAIVSAAVWQSGTARPHYCLRLLRFYNSDVTSHSGNFKLLLPLGGAKAPPPPPVVEAAPPPPPPEAAPPPPEPAPLPPPPPAIERGERGNRPSVPGRTRSSSTESTPWSMRAGRLRCDRPARSISLLYRGKIMRDQGKIKFAAVRSTAVLLAASSLLAMTPAFGEGAASTNTETVHFGTWGVDLSARDDKVKPGDDFQRYASGRWLDAHPIPADQPSNGVGYETYLRNQERLQSIVTGAAKDGQIGGLYASYMDEARIQQLDAAPLKADLARVDAIADKAAFTRDMARSNADFGGTLFGPGIGPDPKQPDINTLYLGTSGLGLPDRDYYLLDKYKQQRDAYRAYIERTLSMIGTPDAGPAADRILAFETEIAKISWPIADLRDIDKVNNPMTIEELRVYAPGVDWSDYLSTAGINASKLIVTDKSALKALAALYDKTPLETLKSWQRFKIADQASPYLSKRFDESQFAFAKTLSGVQEQRPRWRRGIDQVDGRLGEVLGETYIQRYFSPQSKAMMEELVVNLKKAAAKRIEGNSWMEPATKEAALAKLAKMDVMVGYPDKFRDYSKLTVKPDDLYGNVKRSVAFEWDYQLSDLGKPVDRKKWAMSPATVNAYNGGLENKIVFPAGILQPPFFDPQADAAVNYGAIGAIIGHEIMHGFDDQGRKIDASGAVRDWWTPGDATRFKALTAELKKQYASYEAAPGIFINGDLTMGENIGDMSGLEVAYEAYNMSLNGKKPPVVDGLTGDQRFFLAFAQAWRGAQRADAIKTQVASDPHSPRRFRVIGPLRNLDAWYEAFKIGPDSKFYISPEKRVRIW